MRSFLSILMANSVQLLVLALMVLCQAALLKCEYFKSNEITVDEHYPVGAEIVDLRKLLAEKNGGTTSQLVFKLINDTKLCDFIELKSLDGRAASSLVLRKPLDFDLICQPDRLRKSRVARGGGDDGSGGLTSCSQSLKIIRLNENDFIEVPVLVTKSKKPLSIALSFGQSAMMFNVTRLKNAFVIEGASIVNAENGDRPDLSDYEMAYLSSRINYKLLKLKGLSLISSKQANSSAKLLSYSDFFKSSVQKMNNNNNLKLSINFHNEQTLEKAIQLDLEFSFHLIAYIRSENNYNFSIVTPTRNRSIDSIKGSKMDLFFRIDKNDYELEKEKLSTKPLYFERPIYSLVVDDKTDLNATILQPRLTSHQYPQLDDIVFKIMLASSSSRGNNSSEEEDDSEKTASLPFVIDEKTGAIRLKDGKELEAIIGREDFDESTKFTFDIKATYRKIEAAASKPPGALSNSLYSYYNYMIPALAKVEISFDFTENEQALPSIDFTVMNPLLANFRIFGGANRGNKSNQTVVFYVNQHVGRNTSLLNVFLNNNDQETRRKGSVDFKRFYWSFAGADSSAFQYHFSNRPTHQFRLNANTNLDLSVNDQANFDFLSQQELRDQTTYRTSVRLIQKRPLNKLARNRNTSLRFTQINFEFRVDLQAAAFERPVYFVVLNRFNVVNQRLVRLAVNQTGLEASHFIRYSFSDRNGVNYQFKNEHLYLDPANGWLWIRKAIRNRSQTSQSSYEYEVVARDERFNKTCRAKLFILVECGASNPAEIRPLKLFTNNRVQLPMEAAHFNVNYLRSLLLFATDYNEQLRYSLFENSPSQTQVGRVLSVCEESKFSVKMENAISVRVCLDELDFVVSEESSCVVYNLSKLINGPLAFLKNRLQLFAIEAENSIVSVNTQNINKNIVLELMKSYSTENGSSSAETGFGSLMANEDSRLSVVFDLALEVTTADKFGKKFETQIWLRDMPTINNFHSSIFISPQLNTSTGVTKAELAESKQYVLNAGVDESVQDPSSTGRCIFKYDFELEKTFEWSATRFVKLDAGSQVQQEAEYQMGGGEQCDAASSFVITNDGCLTIRYENTTSNECLSQQNDSSANTTEPGLLEKRRLLKKGAYNLTFKLCFYDKNKVACSASYTQLVNIVDDVYSPSELVVSYENDEERNSTLFGKSKSQKSANPFSFDSRFSIYHGIFIGIFVALVAVVLVIIFSFARLFRRKTRTQTHFTIEKSMISSKTNINHSPTGSDMSNAKPSILKPSRMEISNERIQSIKVSDDFILPDHKAMYNDGQYDCNLNLNSNGSYNSLNSASGETSALFGKQVAAVNLPHSDLSNQRQQLYSLGPNRLSTNSQGHLGVTRGEFPRPDCIFQNDGHYFYSVKNAAIHHYDDNLYATSVNARPHHHIGLSQATLIDTNNSSRAIASYSNEMLLGSNEDDGSVTHSSPSSSAAGVLSKPAQQAIIGFKEKTVKQLKKESAMRKNSISSSLNSQPQGVATSSSYPSIVDDPERLLQPQATATSALNYYARSKADGSDAGFDNLASSVSDQASDMVLCPNKVIASIV